MMGTPRSKKARRRRRAALGIIAEPKKRGEPADGRRVIVVGKRTIEGRAKIIPPTAERMAKDDAPERLISGAYRTPLFVDQMHRKEWLGDEPMREMMAFAARWLAATFDVCGLSGLEAQNLTKVFGGGGSPAYMMPLSDHMATHRKKFREAWAAMDRDFTGCPDSPARIAVSVICQDVRLDDVARLYFRGSDAERMGWLKALFRLAMRRLVDHLHCEPSSTRLRSFMGADARPVIE